MKEVMIQSAVGWLELMETHHTVRSMMRELGRSKSWAYGIIRQHPTSIIAIDSTTGDRVRAIPREDVRRYLLTHHRGNPNWG